MSFKISFKPLTILVKILILYAWLGSELVSDACIRASKRNNSFKLQGLIIHPIILGLKNNLNFMKGIFIPWKQFFGGEGSPGALFCGHFSFGSKF